MLELVDEHGGRRRGEEGRVGGDGLPRRGVIKVDNLALVVQGEPPQQRALANGAGAVDDQDGFGIDQLEQYRQEVAPEGGRRRRRVPYLAALTRPRAFDTGDRHLPMLDLGGSAG